MDRFYRGHSTPRNWSFYRRPTTSAATSKNTKWLTSRSREPHSVCHSGCLRTPTARLQGPVIGDVRRYYTLHETDHHSHRRLHHFSILSTRGVRLSRFRQTLPCGTASIGLHRHHQQGNQTESGHFNLPEGCRSVQGRSSLPSRRKATRACRDIHGAHSLAGWDSLRLHQPPRASSRRCGTDYFLQRPNFPKFRRIYLPAFPDAALTPAAPIARWPLPEIRLCGNTIFHRNKIKKCLTSRWT